MKGLFVVIKKQTLAAFPYGQKHHYKSKSDAENALEKYLQSRKDRAILTVKHEEH